MITTPLPFRYVHLQTAVVWIYCLILACVNAIYFTKYVYFGLVGSTLLVIADTFLNCLIFVGMLHACQHMVNPLQDSGSGFPHMAYSRALLVENLAFFDQACTPAPVKTPVVARLMAKSKGNL